MVRMVGQKSYRKSATVREPSSHEYLYIQTWKMMADMGIVFTAYQYMQTLFVINEFSER